jgi:hypothetical protein
MTPTDADEMPYKNSRNERCNIIFLTVFKGKKNPSQPKLKRAFPHKNDYYFRSSKWSRRNS